MRVWGLITALAVASGPVMAQGLADVTDEMLEGVESWDALCEVVDCDLIPMRHDTYVIGPNVYYFPDWRLIVERTGSAATAGMGRYVDGPEDAHSTGISDRTFTNNDEFRVTYCCRALLSYYGLLETVPGRPVLHGRMVVSRHDQPYHSNLVSRTIGQYFGEELADLVTAEEALREFPLSYNEDFAIIRARDEIQGHGNARGFALLSKRPLLHGRHVFVACRVQCQFTTLAFAGGDIADMDHVGDIGDTRPHIHWYWVTLGLGNMFLCTMEEVANGCDPSPDEFDMVVPLLAAVEAMFEAAQVYPQ